LVAAIAYPTLEAITAAAVPGYRYTHDFVSDLGRPDSSLSPLMNMAFVLQGTLFLAGAALFARTVRGSGARPRIVGSAAANAIGNVVVAAVPSGPSGIPWLHASAAVLAIVGGNAAILAGSPSIAAAGAPRHYRASSVGLAVIGLGSFLWLAIAATTDSTVLVAGAVWERASIYTIIGWQVMSAFVLLTRRCDTSPVR
jgi:hypothetical membrane protein